MNRRILTGEQQIDLLRNENVFRCSSKSITYSKNFKLSAIKQLQEQGLSPREIFRRAGFDMTVIGKEVPRDCLRSWLMVYIIKGVNGLSESRGKNGCDGLKTKNLTESQKIRRLETEVAYLKAENDFLARLRAKRRE